jgi:polygalacturonase
MTRLIKKIVCFGGAVIMLCCNSTNKTTTANNFLEDPWEYAREIEKNINPPAFSEEVYSIIDFGAKNDGATDCSQAINNAIDKCSMEGGGKVIVPKGKYLTGAIHLKSNVNLHISEGATLLFSKNKDKYLPVVMTRFEGMECMNYSPFIYAYKQENIAITGKGTIDGQGEAWWPWKGKWSGSVKYDHSKNETQHADNKTLTNMVADNVPVEERVFGKGHFLRPSFISPYQCENILIEDITILRSPMWIVHPVLCENVSVKNIHIESLGPNNDGCNPECCKNVLIENCYFNTGDDCIAIKSGRNNDGRRVGVASENIIIKNCKMVEGHGGVVMGSEISGDVRYVFAENCVMDSPHLDRAIRIKSNSLRGGIIEHIYVRNIEVKEVREAILKINMYYSSETGDNIPIARNIKLENINGNKSKHAVWIKAYENMPASNIELNNCKFLNVSDKNFVEHADKIIFKDVYINNHKLN